MWCKWSLTTLCLSTAIDYAGASPVSVASNVVSQSSSVTASGPGLSVYVTNSNSSFLLTQGGGGSYLVSGAFTGDCNDPAVGGCWSLAVDDTNGGYRQTITGFGAAITDTAVNVYAKLNPVAKVTFLLDFFTSSGINLNLMRHTIGSSDLTPPSRNYTFDDTPGDTSLSRFNLGLSGTAMLGFIMAMKAVSPAVKLVGASWSAPGWMKQNGAQQGWTDPNNYLQGRYTTALANYFVKYLQTYARAGVTVDYLTVQNEPLNSNAHYPTMYVPATDMASFITVMAKSLISAGLATTTKLIVYDHNTDAPDYPQTVVAANAAYAAQLSVGWHCYATNTDWGTLSAFAAANPTVPQFMSECWTSPTVPWQNVPDFTLGPLQNYASGVLAWTLASDTAFGPVQPETCTSCRGLVVVDPVTGNYAKTLDFFLLGQFSKFVRRGAVALSTTGSYDFGGGAKFEAQAFLNPDGSKVVVIENTFGSDHLHLSISFKNGARTYHGKVLGGAVTTWVIAPGH